MNLFAIPSCWYIVVGVLLSLYQAGRGILFQLQHSNAQRQAQKVDDPTTLALGVQTTFQTWASRALADGLLYLMSSLAGFVALLLDYRLFEHVQSLQDISGGAATLVVFLAIFGLLGVTGQLPHLLQQGKWPR
jgi:hypothetical protein